MRLVATAEDPWTASERAGRCSPDALRENETGDVVVLVNGIATCFEVSWMVCFPHRHGDGDGVCGDGPLGTHCGAFVERQQNLSSGRVVHGADHPSGNCSCCQGCKNRVSCGLPSSSVRRRGVACRCILPRGPFASAPLGRQERLTKCVSGDDPGNRPQLAPWRTETVGGENLW